MTWAANDMPDDCHDHCVPAGRHAMYFPYAWAHGVGLYQCDHGHRWTCSWGHRGSGLALSNRGKPHWKST